MTPEQQFRAAQERYDRMEPPEYWADEEPDEEPDDDEEYDA